MMAKAIEQISINYNSIRSQIKNLFKEMSNDQLVGILMDINEIADERLIPQIKTSKRYFSPSLNLSYSRDTVVELAQEEVKKSERVINPVIKDGSVFACKNVFVVNKEKRTVVSLFKDFQTGEVILRGIAKCLPSDCFNVHIGKAIANARALGNKVKEEYLNAPAPKGKEIGDVVEYWNRFNGNTETIRLVGNFEEIRFGKTGHYESPAAKRGKVIDDSNRIY